jgi:hypothetical protein
MFNVDWDLVFSGIEAFATLVGAILIIKQIILTRRSNQQNELIKRKEITLNAYDIINDKLKQYNSEIQIKFNIEEYHDYLKEEDLKVLQEDAELSKKLQLIYDYLGHLAIGVKHEVYDFDMIADVAGRWLVRVYDRYEIYIHNFRKIGSPKVYSKTEEFINLLRKRFVDNGEEKLSKEYVQK